MKIHSLFIGINYRGSNQPLVGAIHDAEVLHHLCRTNYDGESILLVEDQATNTNIHDALEKLREVADSDSTVLVHFSGHGARVPDPCLVTYGWNDGPIESSISITLRELRDWIGRFTGPRVLLFIDACYSGEIAGIRGNRYNIRAIHTPSDVFVPNTSPHSYFASMGNGRVIITASSENEAAVENPQKKHGVFTQCLIEALSDSGDSDLISLNDVSRYLTDNVPQRVEEITEGRMSQNPVSFFHFRRELRLPVLIRSIPKSLMNFPQAFYPLVIVTGDRREEDPKTPGDYFALPASTADLRWIFRLGLRSDTEIISDKVFINSSDELLREKFGTCNLLVIGSPAANHLARIVNETALFWFKLDARTRNETKRIMQEIQRIGLNAPRLQEYGKDSRRRAEIRHFTAQHKRLGFIDPTYDLLERGMTRPPNGDYGVVAVSRNPYAENANYVAILAAGAGLPGTMHSINLLAEAKNQFKFRQLGGIFHVTMRDTNWSQKMEDATYEWSTEKYSLENLEAYLERIKDTPDALQFVQLSEGDIRSRIDLARELEAQE